MTPANERRLRSGHVWGVALAGLLFLMPAGSATPLAVRAVSTTSTPGDEARPQLVGSALLRDAPEVAAGIRLGGLSGLAALDSSGTAFLAVTDRGPNRDLRVHGEKAVAFLAPDYAPSIVRLHLEDGRLVVDDRVPLRLARGVDPVTNGPEVSGLPNGTRDEPAYDSGGRRALGVDPNGVDTEGLAVDPRDGTYWISEEYGPSILHVATDGTILTRLVPIGSDLGDVGYDVRPMLPTSLLQRKPNRGFEGIAIAPDGGTVFAMVQSPLSIPTKSAGEASRTLRLVAVDVTGEPTTSAMYVYRTEPADRVGADAQDDIKIGDIAAVSATSLLVTERDSSPDGKHRKVYAIDLSEATDVMVPAFANRALEPMSDADLRRAGVRPVAKRELVDLKRLAFAHELVEGLAIVDDRTLAVVNDNNFEASEPTELMLIQLPAPVR